MVPGSIPGGVTGDFFRGTPDSCWDLSRRGGRGGTWWWKVGTSKNGGKQWQAIPKNLPRMQRTRAIPVAWLSSGLCPDRPKGWIPIIIIIITPTEPCALRSTQPLNVSTKDFSWGKGGRCLRLTTYHPCSAETSRKSGVLIYPELLGPTRPVAGWPLHFFYKLRLDFCLTVHHQLGKVIHMNQLDATMIYWSIRSAEHVSGNLLPIIRSVRLR